jgi:hypothetical protein
MYEHYTQPRTTTPPGSMRVSDAERAEVTNALCRHAADGRLDDAEFNDRAARANAAKTRDDLAPLLVDLPPLGGPVPEVPPHRPRRQVGWVLLAVLAVLVAGWTFTAAATSVFPWHVPWVPVVIVAFIFLRHRHRRGSYHHHL